VLTDYHLHLSPDGPQARHEVASTWRDAGGLLSPGWIGRYVARGAARAVGEIAITEHVHRFVEARDWLDNPWWRAESELELDAYCDALVAAREEAGLPVLLGIEMDWLSHRRDDIAALLADRPFDIVLGSVHWLGDLAVDHPDYPAWDRLAANEVWSAYLAQLRAAAASGLFDVLAHPDLPKVFGHRMSDSLEGDLTDTVEVIAESGVAIECSSAGLRKRIRELYPDPDLLGRFRRAGVPVTLSSDAHAPEDVARDYPTAVAALRGAGYETITRFRARVPSQEPIA